MKRPLLAVPAFFIALSSLIGLPTDGAAQPAEHRIDAISGGAEASGLATRVADPSRLQGSPTTGFGAASFIPGVGFLAFNFDDNGTETGFLFIPPDPIGAAGPDRLISVVNTGIECRDKTGTLLFRDSLRDFFAALGAPQTLGTFCFDPKVVYDHYENRFVVVALERTFVANGDPADASRVLVAVSKTSSPASATSADWWYMSIDSRVNISGAYYWADYPGFEVDEEAVYVTANMFPFSAGSYAVRLWIIDKGVAGGFYAGGPASWNIHNPIPGGFFNMTMMPALVHGAGGVGPGIGTFLVGYSSLTLGGPGADEFLQVIRVDNPLGVPTFTGEIVNVGELEEVGGIFGFPALPDAPQQGAVWLIEVNDSRALDAVWRNHSLWVTTTINPNAANDPVNTGQATAHWFELNTSAVPMPITVTQQGNIGGEDIATDAWTFFPSVAVNGVGDAMFGFSASAEQIYCGAYYAGREPGDPAGTVQASGVVQAGLDHYLRTFGAGRNRWGDYSGASVDPSDDRTFWIYNEYAETRGTGTPPEDGRWGTAWRSCVAVSPTDFGDSPDPTYPTLLASNGARHTIVQGVFMGAQIDGEPDGLPDPNALGDDGNNIDDEDGVVLVTPLVPNQPAQVDVTVSQNGQLDAWIDFDLNGNWDASELIYSGGVAAGLNPINFNVPAGAASGQSFARFRYNVGGLVLGTTGPAPDGEVEDYAFVIEEPQPELDFGDAPDGPYPTLLGSNGAHHVVVQGVFMGNQIDSEPDGQPDATATGDDTSNLPDEDGVGFVTPFVPGQNAQVDVVVSVDGWLDVWFDLDQNGSWLDPGELVYSAPVVGPGVNPVVFPVPAAALPGLTFARFRFNLSGALLVDGFAPDGEVEDYEVLIEQPQEELDFGDAPDGPYPTLLANNGAYHVISPNVFMGNLIDAEVDGQPDGSATGDDVAGQPDEDGVTFTSLLEPTQPASVDVVVSVDGRLDAWVDFDNNGVWDAAEQIFVSVPVTAGLNSLVFNVPATGQGSLGFNTFTRFRFSIAGGLSPDGPAPDGEVEDYRVFIEDDVVTGAADDEVPSRFALHEAVPNPFNPQTTLSFSLPSAHHVKLAIYDVRGRLVTTLLDEDRGPGVHAVVWDGRDSRGGYVSSGVYLYRIEAGSFIETRRMVLVK